YSGYGEIDIQAALNAGGTPPATPTLVSPTDGSSLADLTPTFDWDDVVDADSYTILVDNASNFSSPEINENPTSSDYTPSADLAEGTYYWKVLATNASGSSAYSGTWDVTLTTPLSMPGIPTLISPTDGSTVEDLTPTFDWSDASDATGYHIQISTNKQMSAIIIDTTTPTSDYTPPSDMAVDVYYWWVSSTNATGESNFTGYWDVDVIAPPPLPGIATLISPADASDTFDLTPSFDWSDATDATGYEILVDNNADFSSPEINTTTTSSDYTPGTDLALDTYYWKVRGTNVVGNGEYSSTWSFNILISPPSAPTLITPADVSTIEDPTPAFDWSDASGATGYEILVDNNADFSSPEINTTTSNSNYTPGTDLTLDTYYWKVLASNSSGDSPYSSTWSFTLQAPLPGVPTLIEPSDLSGVQDTTPYFDWSDASDAVTYDLLVDDNADFSSPEIDTSVSPSEYTAASALALGIYYWKVRAVNATGNSNYSGVWSFDVQAPLPGIPTLISPTDGSIVDNLTPTFDWSDASDATGYHIQISTNKQMSQIIIDTTTPTSDYTPPSDLAEDTYYWWVSSTNATGESSFTGYWDVDVIAPPPLPGIATLLTPSDVSDVYDLTPSFDWSDASDATGYEIFVDNNSDFSSPEINTAVATSDHLAVSDLALDTYFWKVRAINAVGNGEYSTTWNFTVLPLSAPMNIVTGISGSDLVVDWDVVAGATVYDVYSSDDPYGTFTFVTSVGTNQYTVAADQAKLFYYIVATNSTK
ncbi:MAG: hypothetical protein GQ534_02270, partial [Candidatus Delongbacteria bacterium]|nr:hypothetical protein [Candidatus Delongbacteria bacterium]